MRQGTNKKCISRSGDDYIKRAQTKPIRAQRDRRRMQVEEELRVRPDMCVSATPPLIPCVALFPMQGFDQSVAGVSRGFPTQGFDQSVVCVARGFPTQILINPSYGFHMDSQHRTLISPSYGLHVDSQHRVLINPSLGLARGRTDTSQSHMMQSWKTVAFSC